MEQSAVIEDAHCRDQRRANQDAGNLRAGRPMERQQNRNHHGSVDGQAAKKGNRRVMHLARPGQIHHTHTQGKGPHRHDQHQGSKQGDEESEQACGHLSGSQGFENGCPTLAKTQYCYFCCLSIDGPPKGYPETQADSGRSIANRQPSSDAVAAHPGFPSLPYLSVSILLKMRCTSSLFLVE
jgi:hypothetical protein